MIAMKNILIYFDYPITSIQGGTEQASFLLARLLVRQGFRIIFLSLHPFKEKNNEFLQYSLPDSEYLFSRRNADFTEKLCDEQNINFILNEGAASDSSFFFSHAHLNTKPPSFPLLTSPSGKDLIISCPSFPHPGTHG